MHSVKLNLISSFHSGSDSGSELLGSHKVRNFLQSNGVKAITYTGLSKAALAESFQKTLQRRLYTYFTENETLNYTSILPYIIETYNNQIHTSTGYSPKEVLTNNGIQEKLRGKEIEEKIKHKNKKKLKTKFKVGDIVRIKIKEKFSRSYNLRNTIESFKIIKIDETKRDPRYFLEEHDGTDIIGAFSGREITKCNLSYFKGTPIKSKNVKGKKYHLMSWKGYPEKYHSWEPE